MIINFFKRKEGQALVYVAICITVLIGFTGLVIDGGRLYLAKSELQKAVDAGALAGANVMLEGKEGINNGFDYDGAKNEAELMATQNYSDVEMKISYNIEFLPIEAEADKKNIIQVKGTEELKLYLMPILGINKESTVTAFAQVKVGGLNTVEKGVVIPIGIHIPGFPDEPNTELVDGDIWEITYGPGGALDGNFGFLDFSQIFKQGSSTSAVEDGQNGAPGIGNYITNGSPIPISIGDTITTETGNKVNSSQVQVPLNNKVGQIVYVPIVSEFGSGASDPITVLGFAAIELLEYNPNGNDQTIKAIFKRVLLPGEMGNTTTNYGTAYTTELIK